jgi:hypothetical protein
MKAGISALIAGAALLVAQSAAAHHAFSMYDNHQDLSLGGTVSRFLWTNPHCRVRLVVADANGGSVEWELEGLSPNVLIRQGWTRDSLKAGDKAEVVIHPLRDGSHGGSIVRIRVNGQPLGAAGAAPAATP